MTQTSFKDISDIDKIVQHQFCKILESELGHKVDSFQFNLTNDICEATSLNGSRVSFTSSKKIELEVDDGMFLHVINGKQAEKYYSRCLDLLSECITTFRNPPPILFKSLL